MYQLPAITCLLYISYLCPVSAKKSDVYVTDVFETTPTSGRHRRSPSLPDSLHFRLKVNDADVRLRLRRSALVPVETSTTWPDLEKVFSQDIPDSGVYMSMANDSSIIVEKRNNAFHLSGMFSHEGQGWELKPLYQGRRHSVRVMDSVDFGDDVIIDTEGFEETINTLGINKASREEIENAKIQMHILERFGKDKQLSQEMRQLMQKSELETHKATNSAKKQFVVEISMIADFTDYAQFRSFYGPTSAVTRMQLWYTYIANLINIRYDGINHPDWKLNTKVIKLFIFTRDADDDFVSKFSNQNNQIKGKQAIDAVINWVRGRPTGVPVSDHYMWFTQFDICTSKCSTVGVAYPSVVCTTRGVSFNENSREAILGVVAAHELGHSLGAYHDGDYMSCVNSDQFVMADYAGLTREANIGNPWKFSNCSVTAFDRFLKGATCLLPVNTGNHNDLPPRPFGEVMSEDDQCKLKQGKESSYSVHVQNYFGGEQVKCRELYCRNPGTNTIAVLYAQEFTPCGSGKWCVKGLCVVKTGEPTTTTTKTPTAKPTPTTTTTTTTRRPRVVVNYCCLPWGWCYKC